MSDNIDPLSSSDAAWISQNGNRAKPIGSAKIVPLSLDIAAPYETAKLFLRLYYEHAPHRTLHYHRGAFYRWDRSSYLECAEQDLRARAYEFLSTAVTPGKNGKPRPVKPNAAIVRNFIDALQAAAHLENAIDAPAWLGDAPVPAQEIVACKNGLLHLPTMNLLPGSPRFFSHNALNFEFEPAAPEPTQFLHFLGQLWPDDHESVATLQEIFGYCLTGDTRQEKAFMVIGPKRSGKGTIAHVLRSLVGAGNVAAPTLASLAGNFGLAPLIDKRVAIIADARLGGRADQSAIAERLLSITGRDAISADRKYMPEWTGRLQLRFVILSNELPHIADSSGALASRFIVLLLTNSFFGREDHGLRDRLIEELPGILNWASIGWRRLNDRGYFVQPASASDTVQDFEDLGSPIRAFVRDRCDVASYRSIEIGELFAAWGAWCNSQGRDKPGNAQTFGKALRSVHPEIKAVQLRGGGDRDRFYQGIGLR